MREDNHDKRMFYKLIFLMAVSLLIVIVYIWKWSTDDTKEQKPEEMFEENAQQERDENPDGLDEDKINDVLSSEEEGNTEARKTDAEDESNQSEGTENNQEEEADLEQNYINQYSEQEVEQAKEQAEKVLALYLLQVTDWNKWEGAVTSDYLDKMQNEMTNFKDEKAKRELDSIELFASQPLEKGKVTFGAYATWHVTVKGKSTSKPMQLYYMTLKKEGDKWIVNDMMTPNNQTMEGEGKDKK